jgi:hypothetical protein
VLCLKAFAILGAAGVTRRPVIGRNQVVLAGPNQVTASHFAQRFAKHGPVLGVVPTQKRLVQSSDL